MLKNTNLRDMNYRALVSHTVVLVCAGDFGYYILFGECRNEGNHCETTKDN